MKQSFLHIAIVVGLMSWACARSLGANGAQASATAKASLQERIAKQFVEASPLADPGDAKARDLAAIK